MKWLKHTWQQLNPLAFLSNIETQLQHSLVDLTHKPAMTMLIVYEFIVVHFEIIIVHLHILLKCFMVVEFLLIEEA